MPIPVRAKLAPKGTGGNSFFDNLKDRGTEAIGDAVSDAIGDGLADVIGGGDAGGFIGGSVGGAIGGEIGNRVGDAVNDFLSSEIGDGSGNEGYFDGPAAILRRTGGLIFPNTPIIQTSQTANWEDYDLTHSNYQYWAYKNTKVDPISVIGKFTVNTRSEADYVVGAIHFLRAVQKMHFGIGDSRAGTPPPVLEFTALGPELFNNVPVIVTNHQNNFEDSYDYVISSTGTYVPTSTIITISLSAYYNPSTMQSDFTLDDFKNGSLLKDGWI